MANDYTIRFSIRTVQGFERLCDFYLGNDVMVSNEIFSQLEGSDAVSESDALHIDFIESRHGLPLNVKIKHCSLKQMGRNCEFMAKEIFKYRNMVQG